MTKNTQLPILNWQNKLKSWKIMKKVFKLPYLKLVK